MINNQKIRSIRIIRSIRLIILIVFIFFGVLFFAKSSWVEAAVIFSENWDTGTPNAGWPCKNFPSSCTQYTFNSWQAQTYYCSEGWGEHSGLDATIFHSGTRSFKQVRDANESDGCPMIREFGASYPVIYVSMWLYFPDAQWGSGWGANPEAGDAGEHFFFLNSAVAGSPTRMVMDIMDYEAYLPGNGGLPWCWENTGNQAYFAPKRGDTSSAFADSSRDDCWRIDNNTNAWHKFTWMFDITNSKYVMWRDGVQVVGTEGNGVTQTLNDGTYWSRIFFAMFDSYSANLPNSAVVYIDDIIIATTLAEVEAGDTTPPSAPTGLAVR